MKGNNHDRDRKNSSKKKSGNHRPSKPNGKVRPKAGSNHGSKRKEKAAEQEPVNRKSVAQTSSASAPSKTSPAKEAAAEQTLIEKAHRWAELHTDPHTRGSMDKVLTGLSAADQRRVVLCGQRIAAGMSVKLVK
jgi:hypothetical protein